MQNLKAQVVDYRVLCLKAHNETLRDRTFVYFSESPFVLLRRVAFDSALRNTATVHLLLEVLCNSPLSDGKSVDL